jgi:hypothetical protein
MEGVTFSDDLIEHRGFINFLPQREGRSSGWTQFKSRARVILVFSGSKPKMRKLSSLKKISPVETLRAQLPAWLSR